MGNQFANSQSIGSFGGFKEHGGTLAPRREDSSPPGFGFSYANGPQSCMRRLVVGVMTVFHQQSPTLGQNNRMVMQEIVPANATISALRKKAAECEEKAKQASEAEAAKLREEALLCREWIAALRSSKWHS
jgi:hypothetical protein